jgi:hypothetical protein
MSYIGSTPTTQSFIAGTDSFNGTGSQTNFTLSRFVNSVNDIQVVVNNVVQYPPNYSVSGNTLTISPAPSAGTNNVYVRYLSTTLQSITVPGGSSVNGTFQVAQDTYLATSSGNVGVGTTSPDSLSNFKFVDVGSSGTNQGVVQANNGTVKVAIYVNGTNGNVSTRTNHNLNIQTNGTTQATITTDGLFQFNSGYGSVATAYGCRAWVNFNGTGTVAIRASGNVSSITDNGTGDYTVNFTTALPDANYVVSGSANDSTGSSSYVWLVTGAGLYGTILRSTTQVRVQSAYVSTGVIDSTTVNVAIFR